MVLAMDALVVVRVSDGLWLRRLWLRLFCLFFFLTALLYYFLLQSGYHL